MMRTRAGLVFGAGLLVALFVVGSPAARAQCASYECQQLVSSTGQFLDAFGRSVSIDGDLAVITADAEDNHGAAYAYKLQAGQWVEIQKIVPAGIQITDLFGRAAKIVGQRMVIASSLDDDDGPSSGSVYAYEFDGSQWQQVQKLVASDAGTDDQFGWAIAMAGDLLAVGAFHDDDRGSNAGAVYVFRHDGSQWVEERKLLASGSSANDEFGFSVATDGTVVVGATPNHDAGATDSGAAWVFRFDGANWAEEQKLVAADAAADDWLGWSVAVDGTRILVGSTRHDATASDSGAVYEWTYDGATWVATGWFAPAGAAPSSSFGSSLALDGNRLAVGAAGSSNGYGSVYLYARDDADGWVQTCQLFGSGAPGNGMFKDGLGAAVALDTPHVISGAIFADGSAENDAGAAYAYMLDEAGHSTCEGPGAGTVPDGGDFPGVPLQVRRVAGGKIRLTWGASCVAQDKHYAVYEGTIGDFQSHAPVLCDTGGVLFVTLTPGAGDRYYLVVPNNGIREGSYGRDGNDVERAPAAAACMEQVIAPCQ